MIDIRLKTDHYNWGSKVDVLNYSVRESDDTTTITYNTAWSPNVDWVIEFIKYIEKLIDVNFSDQIYVEHRYSELGFDFGGFIKWSNGDEIKYRHFNTYMKYLKEIDTKSYENMLVANKRMASGESCLFISIPI